MAILKSPENLNNSVKKKWIKKTRFDEQKSASIWLVTAKTASFISTGHYNWCLFCASNITFYIPFCLRHVSHYQNAFCLGYCQSLTIHFQWTIYASLSSLSTDWYIFFVLFAINFFCMVFYLSFGCASVWISRCFIHLIVLKHFKWVDRREIKVLILNTDLYHCAKNVVFNFEKGSECVSRLAASGVMRRLSI